VKEGFLQRLYLRPEHLKGISWYPSVLKAVSTVLSMLRMGEPRQGDQRLYQWCSHYHRPQPTEVGDPQARRSRMGSFFFEKRLMFLGRDPENTPYDYEARSFETGF